MALPGFDELFLLADQLAEPVPVVAAGGVDATVIQSLELARRRGWVRPILTGPIERIAELIRDLDIEVEHFTIVEDAADSAKAAVEQVRSGSAKMLMKGQLSTPSLMTAILDKKHGLRTGRTICQVVLMEITRDGRKFLMADTGVTVSPTLEQKAEILSNIARTARALGCESPRIAVMSATEKPTEAMPDTFEARQLVERAQHGDFEKCTVDGPLSFDLAYAADASLKKKVASDVAGQVDAMLFPNLLAANLTVKAIMYTADCRFGGILAGAACPVVFMSRADTTQTRLHSIAYAIRLLQG